MNMSQMISIMKRTINHIFILSSLLLSASGAANDIDNQTPATSNFEATAQSTLKLNVENWQQLIINELMAARPQPLIAEEVQEFQNQSSISLASHETVNLSHQVSSKALENTLVGLKQYLIRGQQDARPQALASLDALMLLQNTRLQHIQSQLDTINASAEIQGRQQQFTTQWRHTEARLLELKQLLTIQNRSNDSRALNLLESLTQNHTSQSFYRNTLPYSHLTPAARPLPQGNSIAPSYQQPEPELPGTNDYANTDQLPHPRILALAQELEYDYIKIYDYVRTQIHTQWYWGGMKSAAQVLKTGAGNSLDQSRLLVELLRASGAAARHVYGIATLTPEQIGASLGLVEIEDIAAALSRAGIAHSAVINAGRISHFEVEHHWVSSYLPYGNYRGAGIDLSAYHWLPLDPSIKQHHYQAASNVLNAISVDTGQLFDRYFTSTQDNAPIDALLQTYRDELASLNPTEANPIEPIENLIAQQAPSETEVSLLPASLPFPVVSVFSETSAPDTIHEQQLELRIFSSSSRNNNGNTEPPSLFHRFNITELNEQRLTLSYAPATVDDFNIINSFGGLDNTPAYLVRLRPQMKLNGREILLGESDQQDSELLSLSLGDRHRMEVNLIVPWGQQAVQQELTVGSYLALAVSPPGSYHSSSEVPFDLDENSDLPGDLEQQAAQLLYSQALRYNTQWDHKQLQLAELWDFALIQALPSISMALSQVEITQQNGLATDLNFHGVVLDAAFRSVAPLARHSNNRFNIQDWLNWSALQGSFLEQAIFRQQWLVESISADTGMALASSQGIPLLSVDQDSNPATWQSLNHHPDVIEAISEHIAAGLTVLIPQSEIQLNQWLGSVWLARDHQQGHQGYFISGRYAGGATTEAPADWLLDFLAVALTSPYSAPPNDDPLAAALLDKIAPTDFQRGTVNQRLERPLAVLVRDIRGRPVSGAEVLFTALNGGHFENNAGSINVHTDDNGIAQTPYYLGTQTTERRGRFLLVNDNDRFPTLHGEYPVDARVTGRLGNITLNQSFFSYAAPDTAEQLLANGDNEQEVFGPNLFAGDLRFRVEDRFGNPVANHQVQFSSPESPSLCLNINEPTSHALFTSPQECQSQFPLGNQCGENPFITLSASDGSVESWAILGRLGGTEHHLDITAANQSQTLVWRDSFRMLFDEGVLNLPGSCGYGTFIEPAVREIIARDRFGKSIEGAEAFEATKIPRLLAINTCYQERNEGTSAEATIEHCQLTTANVDINAAPGQLEAINFLPGLGFYAASIEVANAPEAITPTLILNDVQVLGSFGGQIIEDTWEPTITKTLEPVFAVDSRIISLQPQQISLSEAGLTTHDITVEFEVLPQEFGAETLVILEDNNGQALDAVIWQSPNNHGTVHFPRGLPLELDQNYQVRLLINPGVAEIQGATAELGLSQSIILNVCAQGSLDLTTNQPLCSRVINQQVPTPLFLSSDLDVANQQSCDINEFSLTLSQDATVSVRFERMNADGSGSGVINDLLTNLNLSRGSHILEVNPFELGSGEHRLIIDSISQIDGRAEQVTGSLQVIVQYTDVLPVGHPNVKGVDLFSGDMSIARQDLHIPGRGPQLAFSRSYNSANASTPGVMGAGWTHNYLSRLAQNRCGDLIIIGAEGSGQRFTPTADGFQAAPGYHGTLEALDEGFAFFSKNGTRYAYTRANNRSWWLEQISDPNGNAIDISYAAQAEFPQPIAASANDGRSLSFEYSSRQFEDWSGEVLRQVSGTGGMQIDFEYDARGNLMRATREGDIQRERYDYNSASTPALRHLMMAFVNEVNGAQRTYHYETASAHVDALPLNAELIKNRVHDLNESQGGTTSFSYSGTMGLEPVATTVHPAVGDTTQYRMDRYGVPEQIQDPVGTSNLSWDADHQLRQRTDANSLVQEFDYDEFGNLILERTTNNGESLERRFIYSRPDEFNHPIKTRIARAIDWRGIETQYRFDHRGNPLSETRGGITTTQSFNEQGDRISISDGRGNLTRFNYDERGNVIQMADAEQNIVTQQWDQRSRLISSTDANQNTTQFDYDDLDRLISTTLPSINGTAAVLRNHYIDTLNQRIEIDPEGKRTEYHYDLMGREVEIVNAQGDRFITEYDELGNKTRQIDWRGNATTYTYDNANRLTTLSEPEGRVTHFQRDVVGNITQTRVGDGADARITRYEYNDPFYRNTAVERIYESGVARVTSAYDGNGNLVRQTDAEGNEFRLIYDDRNRLLERIEPLGRVSRFTYDDSDNRIEETRSNSILNQTIRTQFDALNRPAIITNATGDISLIAYDGVGNITEMVDGNRNITQLHYDSRNRLIQQQGPREGFVAHFTYDDNNNRTSENYPNGRTIQHSYDALNRLISSSDALGTLQTVSYDANGNVQSQTNGRNATRLWQYDALNRLVLETAPENRQRQFSYNIHHEVTQTVDARQQITQLNYNQLGQLRSQTLPDQSTRLYAYDRRDNLTQFTDGRGNSTRFEYDALNQLRFVFDPSALGYQQEFRYDIQGNLTHQIDRRGILTLRSYDAQNRLSTETRAGIPLQTLEYDANGNVSRVIDGEGNAIAYRYNGANELLQETRPLGAVTMLERDGLGDVLRETQPGGRTITRSYDIRQRLESETNHAGETTSYSYDATNNLIALQRPELSLWSYAYDDADRLIKIVNPENNQWHFDYDANDNRTAHTDPNQHHTQLDYDPLNRLAQRTYSDGAAERWEYDLNGNIQSFIDAEGQIDTYNYDEINRLTQTVYGRAQSSGNSRDIAQVDYDYDANGNVLSIVERELSQTQHHTTRRYDALDRLTFEEDRHGQILQFAYDNNGNRTQLIDAQQAVTRYEYDALNRLTQINAPLSGATQYQYFPNGQLRSVAWPNRVQSQYTYDAAARVESIQHQLAGNAFTAIEYAYDQNGNRNQETLTQGSETRITHYQYDQADRLNHITYPDRVVSYDLDGAANRLSERIVDQNQALIAEKRYRYNIRDQLERIDDAISGESTSYGYNAIGQQIHKTDAQGTTQYQYNSRRRLSTITLPNQQIVQHQYDDQGLRVSTEFNGTRKNYRYDGQSLTQETNVQGNLIARYTWSDQGLISENRNGLQTYLHTDALATPIAITDTSAAVVDRYRYDAWGNLEQHQGISQQPFGFTGYQNDNNTSLYYAQQRYYNPASGRFLSHDPFAGDINTPISLHRYLYANASPAVFVDPTGEQACLGQALLNCPLDQFVPNNRAIPQNISSNAIQGLPETFAVFEDRIPAGIISLPPNQQIFTENYRLVPEVNPDEPEAALFYTAFRLDTNAPEFAIPPSQLDTFVAHSEKFLNIAALNDTLGGNSPSHIRSQRLFNAVLNQAGGVQDNRSINEELTQANAELLRDPVAIFDLATGFVGAGPTRAFIKNTIESQARSEIRKNALVNVQASAEARGSSNFEVHTNLERLLNARIDLDLNSNAKRRRNFALADLDIDGKTSTVFAISGKNNPVETLPTPQIRAFDTFQVNGTDREFDTEVKILEQIASQSEASSTGIVTIISELKACRSCRNVIQQFEEHFPGIDVEFKSGPEQRKRRK